QDVSELDRQVLKTFSESCVSCHSAANAQGKLRLDSFDAMAAGGASGPVLVPGDVGASKLYSRINSQDRATRMPPVGAALPAAKIAQIKTWIEHGAPGLPKSAAVQTTKVDFRKQVEPILRASCYE